MDAPPPLVMLHAFPLDSGLWDRVREPLGRGGRLIEIDFPGFGRALPDPEPTIDGVADRVAERIAAEPGGRAIVCGLSMGGYLALSLAARHPARVAGLALCDTRATPDTPEAAAARIAAAAAVRREGPGRFLDEFTRRLLAADAPEEVRAAVRAIADRQPAESIARALHALGGRADRRPDLPAVTAPTTVIAGAEDTLTPVDDARALARGIPGAELVVIPGAGHLAAIEAPTEFAAAVSALRARTEG